ncbi:hypothetical protein IFR04_011208 [Cadophora malorum]|uniref:RTA1 like protein n=1 Tax=Cadophora malorum TaxID=108018 RepID=A0A8H7W978_9HELO|nr:hypothetical protein IFR04_011208 [Cadophora malorum]
MVVSRALKDIVFYHYEPSLAAAIVFSVAYSLAFIGTMIQFMRYRSWVWTIMVVSSAMEAGGYIARCFSGQDPTSQDKYTVQLLLIVLAPVCMAAACYIVFGRIIYHVVPKKARTFKLLWMPPRFITPIFVAGDVVALLLQTWGAVKITGVDLSAPDAKHQTDQGKMIAEIGVAVQLIFFGLFSIIAMRFNFTSRRFKQDFEQRITASDEKYVEIDGREKKLKRNWQAILLITNLASVCILVRSVYRMIDFHMGREGYLATHEWTLYIFDSLVIFPAIALFIWWHPSKYLPYMGFRLPKHAR